ncbi:helix-turn-helix domain-containing protein [Candidatus Leptofilum sp.]|uniref:helix-turn-helix domain-containing protein n=1 Tax=Candidatus Leptofilum sp. TaxID=3241576 RepID=UPI003B5B56FE
MSHNDTSDADFRQEWFTVNEAANYLRVTRQTIYRYMDNDLLPYYELKSGRGRRIRRSDLESLLEPPQKRD